MICTLPHRQLRKKYFPAIHTSERVAVATASFNLTLPRVHSFLSKALFFERSTVSSRVGTTLYSRVRILKGALSEGNGEEC